MRILPQAAQPGRRAPILAILLPGALQQPEEMMDAGFADAVRARRLPLDLALVDLGIQHIGETNDGSVLARLHQQVLLPAREHGYRDIWLGGISIGGFMALAYAASYLAAHADAVPLAGLCLLAPYPGSRILANDIRAAGGLAQWTAPPDTEDAECRVWQWLRRRNAATAPPVYFGYAMQDRFAAGQQLMAGALAPTEGDAITGGHDWPSWRQLWNNFLDRLVARNTYPLSRNTP